MSGRAVFMTHGGLIRQDAIFAKALRSHIGLSSVAVVHGRREEKAAEAEGSFDQVLDIVKGLDLSHCEKNLDRNLSYLAELERSAGESTIYQDIFQDRWLKRFDLPFMAQYLVHGVVTLQNILDENVRVVMGEMTMALYRAARRLALGKAPYLYPMSARFWGRIYFEDDLEFGWRRCQAAYEHYMSDGVPDQYRQEAEHVLDGIVLEGQPHAAFSVLKANPAAGAEPLVDKLSWSRVRRRMEYLYYDYPEWKTNPFILTSPWRMSPLATMARWLNEARNIRYLHNHSLSAIPEETKYCIYFLHHQPEYTVEGVGYPFVDQSELVRMIAQCLPVDTLLFVKEQPFMLGSRPSSFYAKLLSFPNVRIVDIDLNSRELIKKSRCVFSICGTAALEALFFAVPTVLFSRVFHSQFKGITQVLNPYDLADTVRALLQQGPMNTRRSSMAALAAMFAASYPGMLPSTITEGHVIFSPSNMEHLGNGLCQEMARRESAATLPPMQPMEIE